MGGSTLTVSLRSCKISVFSWRLAYRTGNLALYGLLSSKAEFTARQLSKSEYHNYLSTCGAKNSVHTFFKSMLRVIIWLQSSFFLHSPQSPRSWDEENCVPDDKYYENADIASFSSVHGLSCAPPFILPFTEIIGRYYKNSLVWVWGYWNYLYHSSLPSEWSSFALFCFRHRCAWTKKCELEPLIFWKSSDFK